MRQWLECKDRRGATIDEIFFLRGNLKTLFFFEGFWEGFVFDGKNLKILKIRWFERFWWDLC